MRELIERLEKLTGPCRETDADVMRAAFGAEVWSYDDNDHIDAQISSGLWKNPKEEHVDYEAEPRVTWRYRRRGSPGIDPAAEYGDLPHYTASGDAARLLLPWSEHPNATFTSKTIQGGLGYFYHYVEFTWPSTERQGRARTEALATCICALLAIEETERQLAPYRKRAAQGGEK